MPCGWQTQEGASQQRGGGSPIASFLAGYRDVLTFRRLIGAPHRKTNEQRRSRSNAS